MAGWRVPRRRQSEKPARDKRGLGPYGPSGSRAEPRLPYLKTSHRTSNAFGLRLVAEAIGLGGAGEAAGSEPPEGFASCSVFAASGLAFAGLVRRLFPG